MRRAADEFKTAVSNLGLSEVVINECSMCGYALKYLFRGEHVYFDAGCYCRTDGPRIEERSWDAVASFYNMQVSQRVIDNLNSVFGFTSLYETEKKN